LGAGVDPGVAGATPELTSGGWLLARAFNHGRANSAASQATGSTSPGSCPSPGCPGQSASRKRLLPQHGGMLLTIASKSSRAIW